MIKLITLDLDGTLLTSDKELSSRTKNALEKAAARGVEIVPATGRYYDNIPSEISELPFINYAITINGAYVYDRKKETCVYSCNIDNNKALEIFKFLNNYDVIYDCYQDNTGWINEEFRIKAQNYGNEAFVDTLKQKRIPVEDVSEMVRNNEKSIQKIQFFANSREMLDKIAYEIGKHFENVAISSSVRNNVEINAEKANKGEALLQLTNYLNIDINDTMAFGDGGNDFSMIKTAGIGVAMGNGRDDLKAISDIVAPSNDEDGVAVVIEKVLEL